MLYFMVFVVVYLIVDQNILKNYFRASPLNTIPAVHAHTLLQNNNSPMKYSPINSTSVEGKQMPPA